MRTTRILKAVNWRYAFGEVLLIVVGILVALAISDWNDRRIERLQELAMLGEVRNALETDIAALQGRLHETRLAIGQMGELASRLEANRLHDEETNSLFGAVYGVRLVNLSTAPYETLKSVGLQTVSNRELRAILAYIFDQHYERLEGEHEIEIEITLNVMRPYFLEHFVDLRFWENATPIDYDKVVNDTYFENILHYRMEALKSNQLESYPLAIADMQTAILQIDEELER